MNSYFAENIPSHQQAIASPPKENFGGFNPISGFAGDERNLGGRKIILDHFSRH
jgi:hypothetical protein